MICIWIVIWFLIKSRDLRKQMVVISLWTSLLCLTEPIFVPAYWLPPSLFDLAARTGFDIESLIFSFGIGGLGFILYMLVFPIEKELPVPMVDRLATRHKYHAVMLSVAPVVFVILYFGTKLNPIYVSVIALMVGGIATWYCRPDLKKKMFVSAFLFLGLYFVYFLTLITMFPGYVQRQAFERAKDLQAVVFDKTGTLTRGVFGVTDVLTFGEVMENELLRHAASLEGNSEHPLARGIMRSATEKGVTPVPPEEFRAIPGKGVEGKIDGILTRVVSPGYLQEEGIAVFACHGRHDGLYVGRRQPNSFRK